MYKPVDRSMPATDTARTHQGTTVLVARPNRFDVNTPRIARLLGAAVATLWALPGTPVPSASAIPSSASAQSCPDAEVVFARGTGEPAGVGAIGESFIDSLRSHVGGKSVGVYAVDYPATTDFSTGLDGVNDAGGHVQHMAATCPNTKMVLGGYSQGAAVMGFVTSAAVPDGAPPDAPHPMPAEVVDHVAAVVLFGKPSPRFMHFVNEPPIAIGPLYAAKTIQLCVPDDPVCSDGGDWAAHNADTYAGMSDQGAAFAASRF
jgi:cutinase